jgi:predicted hotdog family 3-hydroxylacyl-ACP dehydratase
VFAPSTLDRAGIEARIPHRGRMCLLDRLDGWDERSIRCSAHSHRDAANPLRTAGGLRSVCAIEYAAQAMALHGSLMATRNGAASAGRPSGGYLASVRAVHIRAPWLHDIAGALRVEAERIAGDARRALYRFAVGDGAAPPLIEGRAAVVLEAPLP